MIKNINIDDKTIGVEKPVYMIAELSGNHNGSLDQALEMVEAAYRAGADAIKLQTYTADTLTIDHHGPHFQINDGLWKGENLYNLYQQAYTPWEWHGALFEKAKSLGITMFSSPFDESSVEFLEQFDPPAYKIASFELLDIELIKTVAKLGKPVILSTGMASLSEIEDAVDAARNVGNEQLVFLKCTSAYPADPKNMNLRTIPHLSEAVNVHSGLSDHSLGYEVAVASVALGARVIEKHFTLSRDLKGPDSAFSMEPHEFKAMVDAVRVVEKGLGQVSYGPTAEEEKSIIFRRSLFVVKDIEPGEAFTEENVRCIRPGHGLKPKYLPQILGKVAGQKISRGTPVSWDLFS